MLSQLVISGIAQGAVYALVALSMTVIFRATTVVNFGQGELFMLAAYGIYFGVVAFKLPYAVAAVATVVVLFAVGVALERVLIRPMAHGPHLSVAMMTIAIGYILRGTVRYFWGRDILPMPSMFTFDPFILGTVVITADDLGIAATVAVLALVFFVFLHRTTFGKLIQAMAQSTRGARLIGVDVNAFHAGIWGLGAAMAAIAGILVAPVTLLYPDMGANVLLRGFAAMTLGGFGSLQGGGRRRPRPRDPRATRRLLHRQHADRHHRISGHRACSADPTERAVRARTLRQGLG